MNTEQLLADIRERLVRLEEQAVGRDHRLARMEAAVETLERFRWWILAGLSGAGGLGGVIAAQVGKVIG